MEPVQQPQTCVKCGMLVCKRCADKWLKNTNKCPKKCSEGVWQVKNELPFAIEYSCPYDSRCEVCITAEDFEEHLMKCTFIPE